MDETTESMAEVEKSGCPWPKRNGPHSGCPSEPQPLGSIATWKISLHPMGLSGQPSERAIGSHMAITRPDMTVGFTPSTKSWPLRPFHVVLRSSIQACPAGLQIVGFSLPSRIFCIDSPDFM